MADNKTPESEKTVSRTDDQQLPLEGPTPKNDKKFGNQRHMFMSPTDAMTSPCTQQLINHHRFPRRQTRPPKSGLTGDIRPINNLHPVSKLANKENESEGDDTPEKLSPLDQQPSKICQ